MSNRGSRGRWLVPAAALGLAAVTLGWARYVEPRRLEVLEWEVPLEGLAPEAATSILHITDLHVRRLPFTPQEVITAIGPEGLSCPLVCLTGDYCDHPPEVPRVEAFLAPLLHAMALHAARPVRVYAVWGNHDRIGGLPALGEVMARLGVTLLDNTAVEAVPGLWLAGVGDPTGHRDRLAQALAPIPPGQPFVLLAHNPAIFPRAVEAGVPLTLAGHTHGGQVRVGHLDRVWRHDRARKYRDGGWYRQGKQALYVNRGLGMTMVPFRLNARPEATIFRLVPAVPAAT